MRIMASTSLCIHCMLHTHIHSGYYAYSICGTLLGGESLAYVDLFSFSLCRLLRVVVSATSVEWRFNPDL